MRTRTGVGWRPRSWLIAGATIAAGLASLPSCRSQPVGFPRVLFTISADQADYPVMLSRTPPGAGGRKVEATGGYSHLTNRVQNIGTDDAHYAALPEQVQYQISASGQLATGVQRADRWLQIDGCVYRAEDAIIIGYSVNVRELALEGTVYR